MLKCGTSGRRDQQNAIANLTPHPCKTSCAQGRGRYVFLDVDRLPEPQAMTDQQLPDRLSTDPRSPYFNAELLQRGVGIRFKGVEKTNVEEYCVSEGWIRVAAGTVKDRHGNPLTIKLTGPVEPYFQDKTEG
jgi:hypothetical protein